MSDEEELRKLVDDIREAREAEKLAKAFIAKKMPRYFDLLDKVYGKGRVVFDHDGQQYGRIIAEKTSFNAEQFRTDHPDLDFLIQEKTTYTLDEEKAKAYQEKHEEVTPILQQYTSIKEEARWKPPVEVKE